MPRSISRELFPFITNNRDEKKEGIVGFYRYRIKNIGQVEKLEEICENINVLAMKRDPFVAVSLRYIAESVRRSGEYAGDISESVINYLVEEKT